MRGVWLQHSMPPLSQLLFLCAATIVLDSAAAFWGSSAPKTSTSWEDPCVDLDVDCEFHAGNGLCATKPERMRGCCAACAGALAAPEDELLGCPPQTERTLKTLDDQIQKNCLQGSDRMHMHTECTTAARTPCKNSLDHLTVVANTAEGAACNAYMFKNYPDVAVYWGACHDHPAAETEEVRTAQALSDALAKSVPTPIKVFGEIDYTGYYDPQRDVDCDPELRPQEECHPAIRVGWGRPVQISGPKPTARVYAALSARFFVFYGTLSLRMLRLVEQPSPAEAEPLYGSVILQRGGQITIHECVFQTTSPFIYGVAGRAIFTDQFGDVLVRSSRLVLPMVEARATGVTTCTRPPNTPALGDTECIMEINELLISGGEFVATGASQMVGSCRSGSEWDSETMKCVLGPDSVTTHCNPGSKPKIDAVSGKELPGHCVIETVECPSGSTISSDGKKCIRRVVESPVSDHGSSSESACPVGSERQGDTCVYTNLVCQAGSSLKKDADGKEFCVIDTAPECPDGSSLAKPADDGTGSVRCIWDATGCPSGSTAAEDGTCLKDEARCPRCKPTDTAPTPPVAACPTGSELVGDSCLITAVRCPDGATMDEHSTCVQENVQFRATFDESSELFPCKLGLLDSLIAQGFLVSFMSTLKTTLPGCGITGDRACVGLFTVAMWNMGVFVWKYCKCSMLCRKCRRPRTPIPRPGIDHQPYPERVEPGLPLEQPYMPISPARGLLKVTHIRCHDLIAADDNGKSDPYAVLKLSDREGRQVNAQEQQTAVQYETLHPNFSERFQFHINASTVLPDLDIKLMDKDRATFDDHLGQVKIDLHSFFNSRGDWTTTLGPTTVTFELADPEKLVADEHMREREELLRQRGDFDSVAQLGTVTLTMEYSPQRARSPTARRAGSPLHDTSSFTSRSPGRPLRRNHYQGRLEAEREAAARRQRASRSRSPGSVRSRSNSRSLRPSAGTEDERAWWEETSAALNGKWTAVGGEDEDFVELYLHDDFSITGRHLDTIGPDADPAVIEDGVLHPPRLTRGNGAVMSGPGSPGWQRSFELRRAQNAGPIELGTVRFVQRFSDNAQTSWTATLYSSDSGGSLPFMEGHWSGACDGSFRADKASGSRRRLSAASLGLGGASISTVHPNASLRSPMHEYGSHNRTPSRFSPRRQLDGAASSIPKGTLTVKLLRAERLIAADASGVIANCYGKLQLVDHAGKALSELSKTPTISNKRDQEFNFACLFHVDGEGSSSPSSRLGEATTLKVTMMDKGTLFADSFLGTVSIRIADLFGHSSKIASGLAETIEDDFALEDAPDQTVKQQHFERRVKELAEDTHGDGQHDNPHGYVRLALTLTPDQT